MVFPISLLVSIHAIKYFISIVQTTTENCFVFPNETVQIETDLLGNIGRFNYLHLKNVFSVIKTINKMD